MNIKLLSVQKAETTIWKEKKENVNNNEREIQWLKNTKKKKEARITEVEH